MTLPRVELNTRSVIFIALLVVLGWNLSCFLFAAIAGTTLHLYARADGSTWYYVVGVSWLGLRTNAVPPLSGEWWRIVAANLAFATFLIVPVIQRIRSRERETGLRPAAAGEARAPISDPPGSEVRRIHIVSEERVRERKRELKYAAATSGALIVLLTALGSIDAVFFGILSAAALVGGMVTWALYRRAHHTVLVYGEEELRLETGGRPVWEVRWDQIAGWHRENGLHGLVKCIVLDCVDGSTRRVKVGWLRKQVWFFADMLAELAQRTGAQDATPLEEDDPDRGLTRDQEALLSLAVAVAFALVLGILALLSRLAS